MLRQFRGSPSGFTPTSRAQIDESALDWPGDYQGLAALRGGFIAAYGRENDIAATTKKTRVRDD